MKPPFYKIENSWKCTTIYDANDAPICEFDLESFDELTPETEHTFNEVMQYRVDRILKLLNVQEKKL